MCVRARVDDRSVVGFFGFDHDRKLALQALAVSAAKNDVHAVFAG